VEAAGVPISSVSVDDYRDFIDRALRGAKKKPFDIAAVVLLGGGGADARGAVGAALLDLCGGVFLTEDGEILDQRAAPKKAAVAKKTATAKAKVPAIDTSIPEPVLRTFLSPQRVYSLAARRAPKVKLTAVVKALDTNPKRVGSSGLGGAWDASVIGGLVLKKRTGSDLEHYKDELEKAGVHKPAALYRLSFEFWHMESVPEDEWRAMLGVVCALGRDTRGVLYRIDAKGRAAGHDFGG
jgi:hypothetical protein